MKRTLIPFLAILLLWTACSPAPEPAEPETPPNGKGPGPETASVHHSDLQAVTDTLDPGGVVFTISQGAYEREGFQPLMDFLRSMFALAAREAGDMDTQERRVVESVKKIPALLGVSEVHAHGKSTTALEGGGYRTVQALQPVPEAKGLLWTLHGDAFSIREEIARAPASTVNLFRFSVNAPVLRTELEQFLNANLPDIAEQVRQGETTLKTLGLPVEDLLESLKRGVTFGLTLHPERVLPIPLPDGQTLPEPGVTLSLEDPSGSLLHAVTQVFGPNLPPAFRFVATDRDGITVHRIPTLPLPIPMPLNPQLAALDSRLVFATSDELMNELIERRGGDIDSPLHAHVAAIDADEAYQLWILAPEVLDLVDEKISLALRTVPDGDKFTPVAKAYLGMITHMIPRAIASQKRGDIGVTTLLHDHAMMESSLGGSAAFMAPAMLSLTASVAVPAFSQAREASQRNACINNMRRIEAAKDMWAIENNQPTGSAPTRADLEEYLEEWPECPDGGVYTLGKVGESPSCSVHGSLR